LNITSNFDSGNIEVAGIDKSRRNIKLRIRKDTNSDFFQWFHFRLTAEAGKEYTLAITNAGKSSYPKGWINYNVCASYDREEWFRIPTTLRAGQLSWKIKPQHNSIYFAYFSPYSYERHLDLIHQAQLHPDVQLEVVGNTFEGRPIEMLIVGKPSTRKKVIWVIARQHPGESMAEWFIEGMIERLLDSDDPVARKLLEKAYFYIVPNMCIDGAIAGNLRASASGANLNREWKKPSIKRSPEVYHVLKKMNETGVDLFLDVHGDEELPYNFVAASEGIPGYSDWLESMERKFINNWMDTTPDFQNTFKYPLDKFGEANMTLASNAIAHRFGCLSLTIEMPFKDNADIPDKKYGWSDSRSKVLGASVLNPVLHVLGDLK
jgi:murein tripeptide amidase MpaA